MWLPDTAAVTALVPVPFAVPAVAAPGTASTAGPIEGALIDVGAATDEDFAKLPSGAIALVRTTEMKTLDELFAEAMRARALLAAGTRAGVAAIVIQSNRPGGVLYAHPMVFGRTAASIPVVLVGREHAARLTGLRDVRLRISIVNQIRERVRAENVVAEIRGSDRPDEIVLLGAHLDSWGLGTGANDNGVNVALVLDTARAFRELGLRPRRTIRFVLFSGEEQGQCGSNAYVERHRSELGRHVAAMVFDLGSGRTRGFFLNGRPELRPLVTASTIGFSAQAHSNEALDGTDNFAFLLSGVPNLVADQAMRDYLPDYHAETDTLERVDRREAVRNAELAAVVTWRLANTQAALPRQQTRAEVSALLVANKLVEQMRAFDQWEDWEAGRIGFPAE